ncbi:MAG TPA: PH domain-containing protein, partial [Pseudonocardia sp.]|nr:PH domain-containing protein [Pseudonocardia sp.]
MSDPRPGAPEVPDGLVPDGLAPDGTAPDGLAPDGLAPDGSTHNGPSPDHPAHDGPFPDEGAASTAASTAEAAPHGRRPRSAAEAAPHGRRPRSAAGVAPEGVAPGPGLEGGGPEGGAWLRLDPRVLAVFPLRQAGALIPLVAVLLISGQGQGAWQLLGALIPVAVVLAVGVSKWATVRYRVGGERVELRGGLLHREQRSLRRDRVRTVDLRANPAHRLFGLTVVEIGTGTSSTKEGRLSLDAVTVAEGERLRRLLLDRSPGTPHTGTSHTGAPDTGAREAGTPYTGTSHTGAPDTGAREASAPEAGAGAVGRPSDPGVTRVPPRDAGTEVARLHASWLRYAPLTASGLVAVGAVVGTAFRVANDAGVDVASWATVHAAGDELDAVPLWVGVVALVAS